MFDEDQLMLVTRLRAELVTTPFPARKRLLDLVVQGLCPACAGRGDHEFCDADWTAELLGDDDGEYYDSYEVTQCSDG